MGGVRHSSKSNQQFVLLAVTTLMAILLLGFFLFGSQRVFALVASQHEFSYRLQKNLYLLALVVIFPIVAISSRLAYRLGSVIQKSRWVMGGIFCALLACFPKYQKSVYSSPWLSIPLLALGLVISLGIAGPCFALKKKWQAKLNYFSLTISLILLLLVIVGVLNDHTYALLVNPGTLGLHDNQVDYNATHYSLVQAHLGGLPLLDYFSQYGNYGFILAKILWFIPFTPTSLSVLVAVFCVIEMACLWLALRRVIVSVPLGILCFISCLYYVHFVHFRPYWAVLPIRFLPTTVMTLGIATYFPKKSSRIYWGVTAFAVFAPLWNMDFGVPVLLCWWATLAIDVWLDTFRVGAVVRCLVRQGIILLGLEALVFLAFFGWLKFAGGVFPSLTETIRFQNSYFGQGFMSSFIGVAQTWVLFATSYVAGFAYCWQYREAKERSALLPRMVFFLSLLGSGLFAYHIMRAHYFALMAVSWPSVILISIAADQILSMPSEFFLKRMVALPVVLLLTITTVNSAGRAVATLPRAKGQLIEMSKLEKQREFVRTLGIAGKQVVILSHKAAIFHMDLNSRCPLKLPSASEMVVPADFDLLLRYLRKEQGPRYFIYDKTWASICAECNKTIQTAIASQVPRTVSPDGELFFYSDF